MLLADMGADVVKVERPPGRRPRAAARPDVGAEDTSYFVSVNRGKRSVALDVFDRAGRGDFLRLVPTPTCLWRTTRRALWRGRGWTTRRSRR